MISSSVHVSDFRLLLPETIWLEPEQFDQARAMSHASRDEVHQWETYLNALARLGFAAWLRVQIPSQAIHQGTNVVEGAGYLQVGEFKLCLLATEQVLDEVVHIPRSVLAQPALAAHFYVVLEILEEQEQAIVRGFLRYDELMAAYQPTATDRPEDPVYALPLVALDIEINHLVTYTQYSTPRAIPLPTVATPAVEATLHREVTAIRTRLSQWLQGILTEGWQTIDTLVNPETSLVLSLRQSATGSKGGKLINFGMQLGSETVALLVTVVPETEDKLSIGIQVLPAGGATVLPPQLTLKLLSKLDEVLQSVQSRGQDNYIQLRSFKGKSGTRFSIELSLNGINVKEDFEL